MQNGGELNFHTEIITKNSIQNTELTSVTDSAVDYIEVTVADTGCGMSPETLKRIFEPFFTTREQGEGNGLGLASAYGTIQQHKGNISVDSIVGSGSQFKVLLPLTADAEIKLVPTHDKGQGQMEGTGTILVVDDEEILRFTIEAILINYGYNVLLAKNGKEAIDIYNNRGSGIDAVVCDMVMPEMDGYECFIALKKINPEIKFLIASGFTKENSIDDLKEKGLSGFIKSHSKILK